MGKLPWINLQGPVSSQRAPSGRGRRERNEMEVGVIVPTLLAGSHRPRHVDSFSRLEKAGRWVLS